MLPTLKTALANYLAPLLLTGAPLAGRPLIIAPDQTTESIWPIPYLHLALAPGTSYHQRHPYTLQLTLHEDSAETDFTTRHNARLAAINLLLSPQPPSLHLQRFALQLALQSQIYQIPASLCLQHTGPVQMAETSPQLDRHQTTWTTTLTIAS